MKFEIVDKVPDGRTTKKGAKKYAELFEAILAGKIVAIPFENNQQRSTIAQNARYHGIYLIMNKRDGMWYISLNEKKS